MYQGKEIKNKGLEHCSFLYNHSISIYYISKRLGHKNIKITLEIYNHLFEEKFDMDDELIINILDEMPKLNKVSS